MPVIDVKVFFKENKFNEKEKKINNNAIYLIIFQRKKKDTVNMHVKNTVIFPTKKKIKGVNTITNDIKMF